MKAALLMALSFAALAYITVWTIFLRRAWGGHPRNLVNEGRVRLAPQLGIGFVTNFFDALGIGAFAPTTAIYKLLHIIPDDIIPGTINAGGVLPVILEAVIFTAIVVLDFRTLASMIVAALFVRFFL